MSSAPLTEPGEGILEGEALIVDVREQAERLAGHIPGSIHIPMAELLETIEQRLPDHSAPVVFYCAGGTRSAIAVGLVEQLGYKDASSLEGGFDRWRSEGLEWVNPGVLSAEQMDRYARHISLPGVGVDGQSRLLDTRIAIVGAGGLGSPVALYLAAAGVGALGLIDDDEVAANNLQRQIIHSLDHVGQPKTDSARERIGALNPDVKTEVHQERLAADNALRILSGYDIIVDATDNFPTRYLVNDASLHIRAPVVHASIYRFEGQVSVFQPYEGPCYRCVFPSPPPPGVAANCDTGGVLGVLPGVIGTMQATEALKLALGVGSPLIGRLLLYDALAQTTSELRLSRRPDCPACADEGQPPKLVDYDASCTPA